MPTTDTVGAARQRNIRGLADVSDSPQLDVDLLLGHILRCPRIKLIAEPQTRLSIEQSEQLSVLLARRCAGEPIAYITGRKMFRNLELFVDGRVLVPRPESEQIVDLALHRIRSDQKHLRLIDIGTGTGAIALAIAAETEAYSDRLDIVASDVSADAIEVATVNRRKLDLVNQVQIIRSSLLDDVDGEFDIVLANLPYLRPDQKHWSTRFEPRIALFGGDDGFDLYRELFNQLPGRFAPHGLFVAEIDPSQATVAKEELAARAGLEGNIVLDSFGRDRFLVGGTSE